MMRPEFLYKYMSLRSEYTEAAVREPTLWFSRPRDFNAPYECRPVYTFKHRNAEEREQWYRTALRALVQWDPEHSLEREAALLRKYNELYPVPNEAATPHHAALILSTPHTPAPPATRGRCLVLVPLDSALSEYLTPASIQRITTQPKQRVTVVAKLLLATTNL